jgi:ribosome biogenesis GTPase
VPVDPTDSRLAALGWNDACRTTFEPFAVQGYDPARVAVRHGAVCRLYAADGELQGQLAGKFRHITDKGRLPVVGDWVAIARVPQEAKATIHDVLPRKSALSRKVAGRVVEQQLLAANVDVVFLICGLDGEVNPRKIERFLVATSGSGAFPVLVLNKADICPDAEAWLSALAPVAQGAPMYVMSARTTEGLEPLRSYCAPGQTVVVLGASGVGKSTLINRLIGRDLLKTREVRADDRKGRHTTTQRELIPLEDGGLIIDTPGLRELQLWDLAETAGADGAADPFEDIAVLAVDCRFGDCRHQQEPDCAVRAAVADGRLPEKRLESFQKLQAEQAYMVRKQDKRAELEEKARWKAIQRGLRARYKERE